MEFLGEFFMLYDIDKHQLNLGKFRNLKFLNEIPFKKCVFLHLFNNECIIISYLKKKKPLPYQRGGDVIDGHCINFIILFCLVMFHKHEAL
jgi:hypothetical protein